MELMTYSESVLELETLTVKQVGRLLDDHQVEWSDLIEDLGDKQEYTAEEVMGWLGY